MAIRIITGVILGALGVVLILLGGWWFTIVFTLAACVAHYEMVRALRRRYAALAPWPGYVLILAAAPAIHLWGEKGLVMLFSLMTVVTLSACVLGRRPMQDALVSVFTLCYPALPFTFFIVLNEVVHPAALSKLGILVAISSAVLTDIFGLVVGSTLGRHKLCPDISPQKTVEGAIGSLLGGSLGMMGLGALAGIYFSTDIALWQYAVLGLMTSAAAIAGDLVASAIKRYADIKDYGKLFPGHGGVMDRFDSILFTATLVLCFYTMANMF